MSKYLLLTSLLILLAACVFVACDDDDAPSVYVPSQRVYLADQQAFNAGVYTLCWPQVDTAGDPVGAGTYRVNMYASSYRATSHFFISADAEHIPATGCGSGGSGQLPSQFNHDLDTTVYAVGDTVPVTFSLPVATDVSIWIEW